MAVKLLESGWTILLPPKTGSHWVRDSLIAGGVPHHIEGARSRGHETLAEIQADVSRTATFVRHPAAWHASYWAYRSGIASRWDDAWELDRHCGNRPFEAYLMAVTEELPGYLTRMFQAYTGPENAPVAFVGKQESLESDLIALLCKLGASADYALMRATPRANASVSLPFVSRSMRERLYGAERTFYERHGYSQ